MLTFALHVTVFKQPFQWLISLHLIFAWSQPKALADAWVSSCDEAALRSALLAGGHVTLSCNGTIPLQSTLVVSKDTVLDGTGHSPTLDGANAVRVFLVQTNVHFSLLGVTVTRGRANRGAGLYTEAGQIEIQDCTFRSNQAADASDAAGGAIYGRDAELTLRHCTFVENQAAPDFGFTGAGEGGAVFVQGQLLVENCAFIGNRAVGGSAANLGSWAAGSGLGGALACAGTASLQSCYFYSNQATAGVGCNCGSVPGTSQSGDGLGGAIFNTGTLHVSASSFASNQVDAPTVLPYMPPRLGNSYGGAVYSLGDAWFTNSTWFVNHAIPQSIQAVPPWLAAEEGLASGAALFQASNQLVLVHCTIASNAISSVLVSGSGLQVEPSAAAQLFCNLLASNTHANVSGRVLDKGGNFSSDASSNLSNLTSRTNADVRLGSFGYYGGAVPTMSLRPDSPAIDVVSPSDCLPVDQRNVVRPIGIRCDSGAFEYVPEDILILTNHEFQASQVLQPSSQFEIQKSTDLIHWLDWAPAASDSAGQVRFAEREDPDASLQSYRALLLRAPSITQQPQAQTAVRGGTARLSMQATGTPLLQYYWQFNGHPVVGATGATLALQDLQLSQAGTYLVTVSNRVGTVTSGAAVLTITNWVAPSIIEQPSSQTVVQGASAVLSVSAFGTEPLTYQWQWNGEDLEGAAARAFVLTNIALSQAGRYTVRVKNNAGSVTSSAAILTVTPASPPVMISPQAPVTIVQVPGSQTSLSVTVQGNEPLHFQWRFNGHDIAGATNEFYVIYPTQPGDAGVYDLIAMNAGGTVSSPPFNLVVVSNQLPIITIQPRALTLNPGDDAFLNVAAQSTSPLTYQWKVDSQDVPINQTRDGATSASLTLTNVQPFQAGTYTVVVGNASGSVTSQAAVLTVNTNPPVILIQPQPQTVKEGQSVIFTVGFSSPVNPVAFQWRLYDKDLIGSTRSSLIITNTQPSQAGTYSVVLSNRFGSVTSNGALLQVESH